jgi:cell division protein FtsZ
MAAFGSRQPSADQADGAPGGDAGALKDGAKDGEKSRLGRLQPEDRPVPSKRGDEQLEIPAFLRRQIN